VNSVTDVQRGGGELRASRPAADTLLVEFSGSWRLQDEVPALSGVEPSLEAAPPVRLAKQVGLTMP